MDTAHFDVELRFHGGYEMLNKLVVHNASDLIPFTYVDGELKTPEFKVEVYATSAQDRELQRLYSVTKHPRYVDLRYPISVSWGRIGDTRYTQSFDCYLAEYTPPDSIDYSTASILSATLVLRAIHKNT